MVRRMRAVVTQIESVVTPSGNSGHVVVPKAWLGKEDIVTLKVDRGEGKSTKPARQIEAKIYSENSCDFQPHGVEGL